MRWFVEVSRVGDSTPAERYCVEAKAWQAALQETRKLRGDTGPLSKFSIELLDDGYRAVDPIQKIRYLVNQAPSDAPIVLPVNGAAHASKPPSGGHSAPPPSPSVAPSAAASVVSSHPAASSPPLAAAASSAPAAVSVAPGVTMTASAPPGVAAMTSSIPALASGGLAVALAATAPATSKASVSAVPRPVSRRPQSPLTAEKTPRPPEVAPIALVAEPARAKVISDPAPKAPVKAIGSDSVRAVAPGAVSARPAPNKSAATAVAVPEHRVFMSRSQEPKPEAPITYREQACAVAPGTSREAVEVLLRDRWKAMKKELASHPSGQLVQIAVFDHTFEHRPQRPPLGTLAWKDWRGEPVLGFPGFGVPSPPLTKSVPPPAPSPPLTKSVPPPAASPALTKSAPPPAEAAAPIVPIVAVEAGGSAAEPRPAEPRPAEEVNAAEAIPHEPPAAGSPGGTQSEANAAAPLQAAPVEAPAVAALAAAPSPAIDSEVAPPAIVSRPVVRGRRRAGEDLISELFEAMHELHFARDIVTGAEFVLSVLAEVIPCEYALVSVFNINTRKFVVVRAQGPGAERSILYATPDNDGSLVEVMRRGGARAFKATGDARFSGGRFAAFKYPLEQLLCGPVRQGGRYLGLIELGNPLGGKPFHDSEINALDYICEQFADFVASRPVVLDPDVILAR